MNDADIEKLLNDGLKLPDLNIVVSGLAGRFPKSDTVNEFERNLRDGLDMVNDQDDARFQCGLWGLPPRAGRLKDLTKFDASFFGYSKDEANYVDYQMRLLYEVVYESILDSGLNPANLRASNTGVFFGFHCNEFENAMVDDPNFKSNGYYGQFATRLSQYYDFRGLTVTFDAACASGFVGLHHAIEAIRTGLCDRAIVCSSNIPIHPTGSFIFLQMQMLSPTGYSRFMDSRADGYVKSESCVSILLQRKDLALRNYANVMASMTSVDGFKREGITFPSDKSQESLIAQTKDLAGISTNHVEYLEAHGTGTPAGDPQEVKAISNVYYNNDGDNHEKRVIGPLLLGSVKTNMGHSEAASGLCALTKVVLMLENELIYPSLHYAKPNANIESLKDGRVQFVADKRSLRGKIIPLSCYGFGGSNVHVIMKASEREAIRPLPVFECPAKPRLILMFGRGVQQLNAFFDKMLDKSNYQTKNCLADDFLALIDSVNSNKIDRLMNYRGFMILDPRNGMNEVLRSIKKCELAFPTKNSSMNLTRNEEKHHFQETQEVKLNLVLPGRLPIRSIGNLLELKSIKISMERLLNYVDLSLDENEKQLATFKEKDGLSLTKGTINNILSYSMGEISAAYAKNQLNESEAMSIGYKLGQFLDGSKYHDVKAIRLDTNLTSFMQLVESSKAFSKSVEVICIETDNRLTISGNLLEMESFCQMLTDRGMVYSKLSEICPMLHNSKLMNQDVCRNLRLDIVEILRGCRTNGTVFNVEHLMKVLARRVDLTIVASSCEDQSQRAILFELSPTPPEVTNDAYLGTCKKPNDNQLIQLLESIGCLYQAGLGRISLKNLYPEMKQIDKVRRQTPSLSSIFQWLHEESYFVPRYPLQFSKSSAKCEMPVDVMHDRDKYVLGHCIEGRCLFPATGYLFLIWRVFSFTQRKVYDACFHDVTQDMVPIEFHQVRLMRAVIMTNRVVQLYVHLEETTGRFEIKEGGSVVVDGWVKKPVENHLGLKYESVRNQINNDPQLNRSELTKDDIYKQFRVSGYDYGDSFQNIIEASGDGRYCRVKFNGHFVALTDSILQSIFLAVSQYAPSGGLFLPTRFDYVRFQPEIIMAKLRAANMKLDRSDGSLSTIEKREIMTKIMERDGKMVDLNKRPSEQLEFNGPLVEDCKDKQGTVDDQSSKETTNNASEQKLERAPEKDCFFETFCDPLTGIIVTDGIEMRGIKASPAPRKQDIKDVLLESYQFIKDHEEPIEDDILTGFKTGFPVKYRQICDQIALKLVGLNHRLVVDDQIVSPEMKGIQLFKEQNLKSIYSKLNKAENLADKAAIGKLDGNPNSESENAETRQTSSAKENQDDYDIKKNGNLLLLSILDQLECYIEKLDQVKMNEILHKNRLHLMNDLIIQGPFINERLMRPLIEIVLENSCQKKSKLSLLEINPDDGLMRQPMSQIVKNIEPTFGLEYFLAHPEPDRVKSIAPANEVKTHVLKDIKSLLADQRLRNLDLILYKDSSCYKLVSNSLECQSAGETMAQLAEGVKRGGFLIILMRSKLTLTEAVLHFMSMKSTPLRKQANLDQFVKCLNSDLDARAKQLRAEAMRLNLLEISAKCDPNGCLALLYRKPHTNCETNEVKISRRDHLTLKICHNNLDSIREWLNKLKVEFKSPAQESEKFVSTSSDDANQPEVKVAFGEETNSQSKELDEQHEVDKKELQLSSKTIWLCAADTKHERASGLVGMVQALRKELGSTRLRCFYDQFTFANSDQYVGIDRITSTNLFKVAFERDLLWNCVDQEGNLGSYRHISVNQYMSYSNCLCNSQANRQAMQQQFELGADSSETISKTQPACYVNNAARGDLSSFTWFEAPLKYLDGLISGEKINVCYSALNFRDIMLATGRLPLDAIPLRLAMSDCHMGLEFAGFELKSGRRVMGMIPSRGIATQIYCPPLSSIKIDIPDGMDMREASTIPVVYATAVLALIYRGKMQAGESILIHAGSGGVGQAAINLALYFGLEVFTTTGSDEKRQFLLEEFGSPTPIRPNNYLKDDHIFSSRDTKFEQEILKKTSGRGVDLVLNSLADDKLQASVRCLANGGRFLEIGKYDMSMNAQFELLQLEHNKTFHGILLDKLFDSDPDASESIGSSSEANFQHQLECVMETMRKGFELGYVKPIKYTLFKRDQIEEAFRFMASGKHMGKILIEINAPPDVTGSMPPVASQELNYVPRFQMDPDAAHIVTGGFGGFGLELIKWLVNQGARKLIITSRSGLKTGYQKITLKRLEQARGVKFVIVTYDTTTPEGVLRLLQDALQLSTQRSAPEVSVPAQKIGSIFHLAMILKDNLLENSTAEDFQEVCKPKMRTCELLDSISDQMGLDIEHFVNFSSVSSGKGNAGQLNYAYANSFLERVCERRRARNKHALAIQWGAIGDVGAAFENLGGNDVIIGGTTPQRIPSCQATLSKLLCCPFGVCLSVVPVNRASDGSIMGAKGDLVSAIFHVLGIKDSSKVSEDATLGELGLDSLMAVEIRQYIEREYDITLNMQEIRALTIAKIREIGQNEPGKKISLNGEINRKGDKVGIEQAKVALNNQAKVNHSTGSVDKIENKNLKIHDEISPSENFFPEKEVAKTEESQRDKIIDSNLNLAFKPELYIATCRFKPINNRPNNTGRPLFFFPAIDCSFDYLEKISEMIARPCYGLNWTQLHSRAGDMAQTIELYVSNLQQFKWAGSERIIDLVAYSNGFSFIMAMHIMLKLVDSNLKPGKLILLDKSVDFAEALEDIDNLLINYLEAQIDHLNLCKESFDFVDVRKQLQLCGKINHDKLRLISEVLCQCIAKTTSSKFSSGSTLALASDPDSVLRLAEATTDADSGAASDTAKTSDDSDDQMSENGSNLSVGSNVTKLDRLADIDDLRLEIEKALQALIKRHQIVREYKLNPEKLDMKLISVLIKLEETKINKYSNIIKQLANHETISHNLAGNSSILVQDYENLVAKIINEVN